MFGNLTQSQGMKVWTKAKVGIKSRKRSIDSNPLFIDNAIFFSFVFLFRFIGWALYIYYTMSNSLYIPTKIVQKKRTIYFIFTILYIYIFWYTHGSPSKPSIDFSKSNKVLHILIHCTILKWQGKTQKRPLPMSSKALLVDFLCHFKAS